MRNINYSFHLLFPLFLLPVFVFANDCSTATAVNTGSCATLAFDTTCDFGPNPTSVQGCPGTTCTGDAWFEWTSGLGSNLTQYNMQFNIALNSPGTINVLLAYSESVDATGDPCNWTNNAGTEGYTRYQTQCNINLNGPGDIYEFENLGLDGSGTFFVLIELISGTASQVTVCPVQLSTCSAPANDRCSNATSLSAGNGIDPASASGPNVAAWSDAMKGTTSCATKQRLQNKCNSKTEDHYARNILGACFYNGILGDQPLIPTPGRCVSFLENTVWYSFTVPVTASDWYIHIASSAQCSQEPNNIHAMLFDAVDCNNAQISSPNRLACNSFNLYGAVPTADYSFDGSGAGMTLTAGTTYYLVIDGTRGSQCDFCILVSRGPDDPILPADLSHFSGHSQADNNILYWTTNQEDRHNYFEIERSTDGKNFEPIAQIPGKGSLNKQSNYSFTDKGAAIGQNFYRLNMVDQNGMSFHSKTIEIFRERPDFELIELYPNPVDDFLSLHFATPSTAEVAISLWDMRGQLVRMHSYKGATGEERIRFNLSNISPGVYVLKLRQGAFTEVRKVVVE